MVNRLSTIAVLTAWLFIVGTAFFYYPKWKQHGNEATLGYDVAGYYLYLPAAFIYHDLRNLNFQKEVYEKYNLGRSYPNYTSEIGYQVIKYPSGAAVFYAPWFFAGHIYAMASSQPADGYARPYQVAISMGCLIYALIGLWFCRKILLQYFSDAVTAITITVLVLGTNYLNYTAIDHAMTHNLLFMLFIIIIYLSIQYYKKPSYVTAVLIGFLTGLAIITRPSEIVIVCIPFLWGVSSYETFVQRLRLLIKQWDILVLSVFACITIVAIQLFYWKYTSGNFIEYSYGDQGFQFFHPFIYQVLFTFRKGWFVYTPLMVLIIPGFIFLYKNHKQIFWASLVFFLLTIWIVASWEIWWYGGSLGQRALVQSYAILIFPIAALIQYLLRSPVAIKSIISAFITFCITYNLFLTWQAHAPGGIFEAENMNRNYFWKIFFKTEIPASDKRYLDKPDGYEGSIDSLFHIIQVDFENDTTAVKKNKMGEENTARIISKEFPFYSFGIEKELLKDRQWVRVAMICYTSDKEWNIWQADQFVVKFKSAEIEVKTNFIRIQRIIDSGNWTEVWFDARIPETEFDYLEVVVMNLGSDKTLLIDNIVVNAYN